MSTETKNYKLIKPGYPESADIEVINDNMDKLDGIIGEVEKAAFYDLIHARTDTLHTLTGGVPITGIFVARFLTTAPYSIGDTFKINSTSYTVTNIDGSDLGLNCFASGVVVLMGCEVATSKASLISSGGGSTAPSKYSVVVEVETTNPSGCLEGANVTINEVVYAVTGKSGSVSVDGKIGQTFAIRFSEKDEYFAPEAITYTVTKDVLVKIFKATYTWNRAFIDVSTDIGQAITVGSETKKATSQVTRFAVLPNTAYSVSVNEKAGFIAPSAVTVTSAAVGETVIVEMKYEPFSLPIYSGSHTITEVVKGKKGYITLKSSGTLFIPFTMPVDVFAVGGGARGGDSNLANYPGNGGGSGYCENRYALTDIQRKNVVVLIGGSGGNTSIHDIIAATGSGANGGSAGGWYTKPGASNGGSLQSNSGGIGSGKTTYAFGSSEFPLFAGGGGGGGGNPSGMGGIEISNAGALGGAGGGGNGGTGAHPWTCVGGSNGLAGRANTGSGGGGGGASGEKNNHYPWTQNFGGAGGSGVVIIRWGY